MHVCHTEVMKMIKELEAQKQMLIRKEDERCTISYKEGEERLAPDYDYAEMRDAIEDVDSRIRHLRSVLARANCEVYVDKFDITLGEALVMLAQLQQEKVQVETLAARRQITRRITMNGVLEFTECLYDTERAEADAKVLRETINDLQMAIDRANLTNYVEV